MAGSNVGGVGATERRSLPDTVYCPHSELWWPKKVYAKEQVGDYEEAALCYVFALIQPENWGGTCTACNRVLGSDA